MPIYKKHRVFSEKLTSVEDPIAVVQRGVIEFVPSKGRTFLIPTFIDNPVNVKLQALSLPTQKWLNGASNASQVGFGWFCDNVLHYATNAASSSFGSIASTTLLAAVGKRIRMVDSKLYVAVASSAAGYASNTVVAASTDYWRQLEEFGSNARRYLVVTVNNGASAYFKAKKQAISYEVIGYEY